MYNEDLKKENENIEDQVKDVKNDENKELIVKEEKIAELNNQLLRLQADFINFRKRSEKEKESSIKYGVESFACDLLPVLDNFQRALNNENNEDAFYQGMKLIEQQLTNILNNYSITEIDCLGKEFDPNYHHAVVMEESADFQEGMVIEVLQKGYILNDKVIRPSMVKVSK